MIRINLLPHTKRTARAGGGSAQQWAVIYLVGVFIWCAVLGIVYWNLLGELEEQQSLVAQVEEQLAEVKKKSGNLAELKKKLEASKQLEKVVDDLNRARTGPTRMMMEISKILSVGSGPTIDERALEKLRRVNPHARINDRWDVKRLWITSFEEQGRVCKISGEGRSNDDVAEFQQRLVLSQLFDKVVLERTEEKANHKSGLDVIQFEMTCQVTY